MQANRHLISYMQLRQLIGWLGILLPFLCWLANVIVNQFDLLNNPMLVDCDKSTFYIPASDLKSSISHFYYTASGPLFTGILITVAVFLFCYYGYEKQAADKYSWLTDRLVTSVAAIAALGVVFFPTGSDKPITDNIHIYVAASLSSNLHSIFAIIFFFGMATMSIINFRRQPAGKMLHNAEGKLYLICGWGIIACIAALAIYFVIPNNKHWLWGKYIFFFEVIMLILFGIAWLRKGWKKNTPVS